MRIAEYKQIDTKIINEKITTYVTDEDGSIIGEREETVTREIPVMGMVYRDATEEEVEDHEKAISNVPPIEPTLEDKVNALMSYMGLKGVWNGSVFEVVKEEKPIGDYVNPIPYEYGMEVEMGKFYKFTDGNIWEAIKSGSSQYTTEWFDII